MRLTLRRLSLAAALVAPLAATGFWGGGVAPASAQTLSGSFLAARHAVAENDFERAAYYWRRAVIKSPGDARLMSQALFYSVLAGESEQALPIARRLATQAPSDRIANLVLAVEEMRTDRNDAALGRLDRPTGDAANSLMMRLLLGWAKSGAGDDAAAETEFTALDNSAIYKVFGQLHAGHQAALVGDYAAAEGFMAAAFEAADNPSLRMILGRGAILAAGGRWEEAADVYEAGLARDPENPELTAAMAQIEARSKPALLVDSSARGAAEALFGMAGALRQENSGRYAMLYARLAQQIAPEFPETDVLIGDILMDLDRYESAIAAYERIAPDHTRYSQAQIGVASAMGSLERAEEALDVLRALAVSREDDAGAYFALAQLLSAEERFEECAAAFDEGLKRIGPTSERHWAIYYRRGVCLERLGDWDRAEENFLLALELRPNQPDVLNYLGYSLIEQRRRYDEARGYLERAVAERPDAGYIVDSLGWLFFRTGDYEAAAAKLEEAVRLDPVQPVILDHLGDALWKVGRKMEARFQWKRSLSFEPEEKDRIRTLRKLDVGLDVVLAEEEAAEKDGARKADTDQVDGASDANGG